MLSSSPFHHSFFLDRTSRITTQLRCRSTKGRAFVSVWQTSRLAADISICNLHSADGRSIFDCTKQKINIGRNSSPPRALVGMVPTLPSKKEALGKTVRSSEFSWLISFAASTSARSLTQGRVLRPLHSSCNERNKKMNGDQASQVTFHSNLHAFF